MNKTLTVIIDGVDFTNPNALVMIFTATFILALSFLFLQSNAGEDDNDIPSRILLGIYGLNLILTAFVVSPTMAIVTFLVSMVQAFLLVMVIDVLCYIAGIRIFKIFQIGKTK